MSTSDRKTLLLCLRIPLVVFILYNCTVIEDWVQNSYNSAFYETPSLSWSRWYLWWLICLEEIAGYIIMHL